MDLSTLKTGVYMGHDDITNYWDKTTGLRFTMDEQNKVDEDVPLEYTMAEAVRDAVKSICGVASVALVLAFVAGMIIWLTR